MRNRTCISFDPVRTQWLYYAPHTLQCVEISVCFPYSAFVCFVWVREQTAIISLYNTDWLVCVRDGVCLLRGKKLTFMHGLEVLTFRHHASCI